MSGDCSFCAEFCGLDNENNYFKSNVIHALRCSDRIVYETANWVVLPSLGGVVEGYLLAVSKHHYTSISKMPMGLCDELDTILVKFCILTRKLYGKNAIVFEHGVRAEQVGGGCVDHAHVHIVPFNGSLLKYFDADLFFLKKVNGICDIIDCGRDDESYIYYMESVDDQYYITSLSFESQFIRKLLVYDLGLPDTKWNWKVNLELCSLVATFKTYKKYFESL